MIALFQFCELLFRKHILAGLKVAVSAFPRLNTLSRKLFYHVKCSEEPNLPSHLEGLPYRVLEPRHRKFKRDNTGATTQVPL